MGHRAAERLGVIARFDQANLAVDRAAVESLATVAVDREDSSRVRGGIARDNRPTAVQSAHGDVKVVEVVPAIDVERAIEVDIAIGVDEVVPQAGDRCPRRQVQVAMHDAWPCDDGALGDDQVAVIRAGLAHHQCAGAPFGQVAHALDSPDEQLVGRDPDADRRISVEEDRAPVIVVAAAESGVGVVRSIGVEGTVPVDTVAGDGQLLVLDSQTGVDLQRCAIEHDGAVRIVGVCGRGAGVDDAAVTVELSSGFDAAVAQTLDVGYFQI
ncbi:hypothetical protein CA13_06790 [Planctomycetes bacterium CA13]|uniref:Uncharacterized protein n=1 Tax=Novipirellula herctigrandis TaxID=2527986 RepID=A0A5C5YWY3_9BACT|nr:hypothetical protein CA13_06790 [Planctomycetes bacterium CA13]